MTGEVIKEFLVGLGFGVDESSLKKFNKAIDNAYVRVGLIATAVTASAAGIFAGVTQISQGFEQMGYEYRIIAPMLNRTLMLRRALLQAYGQAGINITKAVRQSVVFNFSLAKTKFQLEGIYKSVGMRFLPMLTKQMDIFRGKVIANMPSILKFLDNTVKLVFKAFEGVTILGQRLWGMLTRVWEVLKKLDEATNGWSTKVIGLIALWKVLNLAFLASPIGILITSIIALIALYDDFMVWKEGGESLINWGDTLQGTLGVLVAIVASIAPALAIAGVAMKVWGFAVTAVTTAVSIFSTVMKVVRAAVLLFNLALYANPIGLVVAAIVALGVAAYAVYKNWDVLKKWFVSFFDWIGDKFKLLSKVKDFFGGGDESTINVNKNITSSPLGSTGAAGQQNINQQNQIVIHGATDPQATAAAVGGAQSRVNNDMVRNFKGAVK